MKLKYIIHKSTSMLLSCLLMGSSLIYTSCDKDDEKDNSIVLNSFGPCPALRGGELRFIGNNINNVSSIQIPGTNAISEIVRVNEREIKITIPQDAETGYITLTHPKGEITTLTKITYTEPIEITSFSPASIKAGSVLTINGDYLNLIREVIFFEDVVVTEFESQSRKKIELIVPAEAQSGKFRLSNGAEIPIEVYSDTELEVALPKIESVSPNPLRAEQELVIKGKNLDLVSHLVLPGDIVVEPGTDVTTEIVVSTPANIQEGKVQIVAKSGVIVESPAISLIKPIISGISSKIVKNLQDLTIEGENLDLVSDIMFGGVTDGVKDFKEKSASKIVVEIPATATDGEFVLNTLSLTTAIGEGLQFIMPEVVELSATSIKAKQVLTMKGSDLDLISKVNFGEMEASIESSTATDISVVVPIGASSGNITITTINGSVMQTTQSIIIDVTLPEITSITSEGPGNRMTIEGNDLDLIKSIYFEDADGEYSIKCSDYGIKSDSRVEFYHVAGAKTGMLTPKMVTFDGDEGFMPEVWCSPVEAVKDPTLLLFDFDSDGQLPADGGSWSGIGGLGDISDGISGNYYEIRAENWSAGQYWWFAENYVTHPSVSGKDKYNVKFDVRLRYDVPVSGAEVRLMLGGNVVNILPYLVKGNAWSTSGHWTTISIPLELWTGMEDPTPEKGGEWGIAVWDDISNFTGFCIDNIRYELK